MNSASGPANPLPSRYLHLWFPRLSTDRLRASQQDAPPPEADTTPAEPWVTFETVGQSSRIVALDAAAQAAGLESGLTLRAARARLPLFRTALHDVEADARLLQALATLCRRYTPAVAATPPATLRLNLTGCGPLWGGEAALLGALLARLQAAGLSVRHGLADTPGLAQALCGWGKTVEAAPGEREAVLAPLPVAALRLETGDETALQALGLRRIGQLLERPPGQLSDAFEGRLSLRLDQVLGRRPEPLPTPLEPPAFRAERRLFEPIALEAQVMGMTRRLADDLCEQMARRGVGARQAALDLFRVDGAVKRLSVRTARPLRDPADLARLFESRLAGLNEGLEADFGFDVLRLSALQTEALRAHTRDLLDEDDPDVHFAAFVESVQARLGSQAVLMPQRRPSTQKPEREWRLAPVTDLDARDARDGPPEAPAIFDGAPLFPLRMFRPPQPIEVVSAVPEDPPARFVWRRLTHVVVRAEGPQRLSPEWGREPESARIRDYYRVEDAQGLRFWLFREGLFGVDATLERPPRWFLHGLFA